MGVGGRPRLLPLEEEEGAGGWVEKTLAHRVRSFFLERGRESHLSLILIRCS